MQAPEGGRPRRRHVDRGDRVVLLEVHVHLAVVGRPGEALRLQVHPRRVGAPGAGEVEAAALAAVVVPVLHGLQRQGQVHAHGDERVVARMATQGHALPAHAEAAARRSHGEDVHRALGVDQRAVHHLALPLVRHGHFGAVGVRLDHVRQRAHCLGVSELRSGRRGALDGAVDAHLAVAHGVGGAHRNEHDVELGADLNVRQF
mmetsp:Transcript_37133/g.110881  ORF Transcript_37133/g.110881 Transcript_37133/m.110881 type:complete len:203 (-) Transcript_37133:405-1013(-)